MIFQSLRAVALLGSAVAFFAPALQAQGQPGLPPGGYKAGFPATGGLLAGGGSSHGRPAIADLGLTPGHKSIIFGTANRKLYVVKYDGTVATGFPVTLPGDVYSSPAVADINNDGIAEIVVGYGSTLESAATGSTSGGVRAYSRAGVLLWDRPSNDTFTPDGLPDAVMSTPAIGDIDGDGLPEVVWGSIDGNVYVVRGSDGTNKPNFPHFVRDTIFSSPALADLDGDGKLDIIIGVDAHLEGPPFNTPDGGCLHVFRYTGTEVSGFPQCIDQVIASSPAVGDIDGDGKPEIVVGTGSFYPNRAHKVYAFKCDGTVVPGWPVSVDGQVITGPTLADLDADGVPEVIVTDDTTSPSTAYHVYVFKGNGTLLWKRVPKSFFATNSSAGDPIVADILGDARPEVIIPTNTELCVFDSNGNQLTDDGTHAPGSFSFYTETSVTGTAVADFEPDNLKIEIVAVSATPFPSATDSKIYVWNPKATTGAPPWGMFHQSAARLGVVPGTPTCLPAPLSFFTLTPCRVVDTRNPNGPLGGPALAAMTTRDFPVGGNCGIPTTAKAVSLNITVTGTSSFGDLRLYPVGAPAPSASTINWSFNQTRANNAIIGVNPTSHALEVWCVMPSGGTQVILDVNGYFQ